MKVYLPCLSVHICARRMIVCGCGVNEPRVCSVNTRRVPHYSSLPRVGAPTVKQMSMQRLVKIRVWKSTVSPPHSWPSHFSVLPLSWFHTSSLHTEWTFTQSLPQLFWIVGPQAVSQMANPAMLRKDSGLVCTQCLLKVLQSHGPLLVSFETGPS